MCLLQRKTFLMKYTCLWSIHFNNARTGSGRLPVIERADPNSNFNRRHCFALQMQKCTRNFGGDAETLSNFNDFFHNFPCPLAAAPIIKNQSQSDFSRRWIFFIDFSTKIQTHLRKSLESEWKSAKRVCVSWSDHGHLFPSNRSKCSPNSCLDEKEKAQ